MRDERSGRRGERLSPAPAVGEPAKLDRRFSAGQTERIATAGEKGADDEENATLARERGETGEEAAELARVAQREDDLGDDHEIEGRLFQGPRRL